VLHGGFAPLGVFICAMPFVIKFDKELGGGEISPLNGGFIMRSADILDTCKGYFILISLSTPLILYISDCRGWGTVLGFYLIALIIGLFSLATMRLLKNNKCIKILYVLWLALGLSLPFILYLSNCHLSSLIYITPLWIAFFLVSVYIVRISK
jgi:hypothetical protein